MSSTSIYISQKLDNSYYVYIYLDPFTEIPFYVGKGKNGRLYEHLNEKNLKNTTKFYNKLNKILRTGYYPIIYKIEENLSNSEALDLEQSFIKHFGIKNKFGGILYNSTIGGRGGNTYKYVPLESRVRRGKRQSEVNAERFKDLTQRKNISDKIKKFRKDDPERSSNICKLRYKNMRENGTAYLCTAKIAIGNNVNFLAKRIFRWMNNLDCKIRVHNLDGFKVFLNTNRQILTRNYLEISS